LNKLGGALQENIITLAVFDKKAISLIMTNVKIEMFDSSVYKDILEQAFNYYREFKRPIKEHLPDTLDHILRGDDESKAELYKDVIQNIYDAKDDINSEYVLKELSKFVRQKQLLKTIKHSAELLHEGKLDEAEVIIRNNKASELNLFDPGVSLANYDELFKFMEYIIPEFSTGIKALDDLYIAPTRKELFTIVGLTGRGKSWFGIHIGKTALKHRKKVLHITLEMPRERVIQRYLQAFFAISNREVKEIYIPIFEKGTDGYFCSGNFKKIKPKLTFDQPNIKGEVIKRLDKLKKLTKNLRVQFFPSTTLSMSMLRAYIENLIYLDNFMPDIIVLDYPDLMKLDVNNLRIETGQIYRQLRGIAGEYNLAMVVMSQANQTAKRVKWITDEFNEDSSKGHTNDNVVTFNQSDEEALRNLARLFVSKARNESRQFNKIAISQNYKMGQFCLDSIMMNSKYDNFLKEIKGTEIEESKDVSKSKRSSRKKSIKRK
jgi:replicative DNA helicase